MTRTELPPEIFLDGYEPPIRDLAEALRRVVTGTVPDAIERVRTGWRLIGYDAPIGTRSAYFAFVAPEPAHVHLGFEHGILLDDPDEVLLGRGVTRQVRWFTFRPGDVVDAGVLAPFVVEAARIARLSREERYALAVDRSERGVA